jgi:hypothetical protein
MTWTATRDSPSLRVSSRSALRCSMWLWTPPSERRPRMWSVESFAARQASLSAGFSKNAPDAISLEIRGSS